MPPARPFTNWLLAPPVSPGRSIVGIWERPTGPSLLERLRTEAELKTVGAARFQGPLAQRNAAWLVYRNFLRQALSNFRAALGVENRSASLLYYYAMLNFAKAELLALGIPGVDGFIGHGLTFNVTRAKTVEGDSLTVRDGVFPALYQARTGRAIRVGTRLPIGRLIAQIPEIGEQAEVVKVATPKVFGLLQLIAVDASNIWTLLAVDPSANLQTEDVTGRLFRRHFTPVDPPPEWKDRFAVSRRWPSMLFAESRTVYPFTPGNDKERALAQQDAVKATWTIRELLAFSPTGMWDAWLAPSLYKSKLLPMPPALARYALAFYASSLVRYRPSMFDTQVSPDQAYFFDSFARESAVPMLLDVLSGLTRTDYQFWAEEEIRV